MLSSSTWAAVHGDNLDGNRAHPGLTGEPVELVGDVDEFVRVGADARVAARQIAEGVGHRDGALPEGAVGRGDGAQPTAR